MGDLVGGFSARSAEPTNSSPSTPSSPLSMSPGPIKTVEIYEPNADLRKLSDGEFRLCFARTFVSRGRLVSNTTWKSVGLSPVSMKVSWQPSYALNWTSELPGGPSDPVGTNGRWQPCKLGEAFDLSSVGTWSRSTENPIPGKLMVGLNHFKSENGIYIVLGLQGRTEIEFQPIFVDRVALGLNMTAWFEPSEVVKWWFESGLSSADTLAEVQAQGVRSPVETYDMASADYVSSTYNYVEGIWTTSTERAH